MRKEKILIIGGVAAGTKTAAKTMRENPEAEVVIVTKDEHISYAGCGLPYFIGGIIEEEKELVVKTPEEFTLATGVDVFIKHEAKAIDMEKKEALVVNYENGEEKIFSFDKLVFATGASPFVPPIKGVELENVYSLRRVTDAIKIRKLVDDGEIRDAVVIGGGFIGLEVAENLKERGVNVSIIELVPHILPPFDEEMALLAQRHMVEKGVDIFGDEKAIAIEGIEKVTGVQTDKRSLKADLVIVSVGVRPNVALAKSIGVEMGETRAIKINDRMETNLKDVFAVGDCAETKNLITGKAVWYPMGSTANKMGRIAGINIVGDAEKDNLKGVLGTTVVKLFGVNAAKTGLSERDAVKLGYEVESVIVPANDRAHYFPGYRSIVTKLIAEKESGIILGAQIIGEGVVDKPIDIMATAITFGAKVADLEKLDLAYAPPFSSAMASTIVAANVLRDVYKGKLQTINPRILKDRLDEVVVLDVRDEASHFIRSIPGSVNIYSAEIKMKANELDKTKETVIVCKLGKEAYLTSLKLKAMGFEDVKILDGGMEAYAYETE
jgi:NADPH-dependent 2,4-dienoyl-CoA reductase/sulfur reductase-like enzyme/rhodanese-related sulfurtransferase